MTKNINASIPDEVHEALAAQARDEDRTLGAHVGRILRQHVEAWGATPNDQTPEAYPTAF